MTHLTVPIMVDDPQAALAAADRAAELGADLIEWRIDRLTDDAVGLDQLIERCPLPCIVTCRPIWEGGEYKHDEVGRLALFQRVAGASRPPAYIDVELAAYQSTAAVKPCVESFGDTGLILSAHDFDTRPADLLSKLEAMAQQEACRVIKVAWQARSLRDNIEAFEIIGQKLKPTIALCMGPFGLPSRVLARKFGALLTFASLDDDAATAPGQVSIGQMKNLYRWDSIDSKTQVYGVIGYPVGHSMSPAIHNAGFDQTGYNGVYLPMPIGLGYESFKATVGTWLEFKALHFRGASVTIPHKENLLRFVAEQGGEIEELAQTIGAANTLTVRADGAIYASNTDYAAALDSVCAALDIERGDLGGRRVAVIGAGGAARAVVAGFAAYGAEVVIYNRTPAKALALAEPFGEDGPVVGTALDQLDASDCEMFINCTPIGMHPDVDASPLSAGKLQSLGRGAVVFDTIYNPAETMLVRQAKEAGCVTISGAEMFVRQAAGQFELWTDHAAPRDVFGQVLKKYLGQ
jgi:3-dehydroquinate dehydratase/shikimate dehydrogenase